MDTITGSKHCIFLYYGIDHLLINLFAFIKEGIRLHEYTFLFVQRELYEQIIDRLSEGEREFAVLLPPDIFTKDSERGLNADVLKKCVQNVSDHGHGGARIIINYGFVFECGILGCDLIGIEQSISSIAEDLGITVLCAYDFEKIIKGEDIEYSKYMQKIYYSHSHRMYEFEMLKIS